MKKIIILFCALCIIACKKDDDSSTENTNEALNFDVDAVTTDADFSGRSGHSLLVFNNKLWVIGGVETIDGRINRLNDVWYSSDGTSWTEATANADFSPRYNHTSVVFDDKLWVIGGYTDSGNNDVWYSSDGISWTEAIATADFSPRYSHTSVVFDNKLWVIAGYDGSRKNDIWYSSDGINWTEATTNAGFSPRNIHTSVVFDNKIWVIGGVEIIDGEFYYLNDVWSSSDGISWTEVITNAPFSGRKGHASVVFNDKLWVIGGDTGSSRLNDIWCSTDGISWTEAITNAPFSGRENHTSVIFNDKLWVVGGYANRYENDVWAFE